MATSEFSSGLAHFTNSTSSMNRFEPLYVNQYEVLFTPPAGVLNTCVAENGIYDPSGDLLLEQVLSIKGLPEITPTGAVTQHYKFSERAYADGGPKTTCADLTIEFEVNLDDSNSMFTYNTLRQWANIHYNPNDGSQSLKRNYYGKLTVVISNKAKGVYRVFDFLDVIMLDPLNSMDLDYTKPGEIYKMTVKFKADWWKEYRNGGLLEQGDAMTI